MCIMSASPDVAARVTAVVTRLKELMEGGRPAEEKTVGPLLLQLETEEEMSREALAKSGAGHCIKALRKYTTDQNVANRARELIKSWQIFRDAPPGTAVAQSAVQSHPDTPAQAVVPNGLLTAGDSSRGKRPGNESPHNTYGSKKTWPESRAMSPLQAPRSRSPPPGPVKRTHDQTEDDRADQYPSQHPHKKHRSDDKGKSPRPSSASATHSPRPSSHTPTPTPTQPAQSAAGTPKAEAADNRVTTAASTRPSTPNLAVKQERPITPMSPSRKDKKDGEKEKNGVVDTATEGEANGEKKHKKKKEKKEKKDKKDKKDKKEKDRSKDREREREREKERERDREGRPGPAMSPTIKVEAAEPVSRSPHPATSPNGAMNGTKSPSPTRANTDGGKMRNVQGGEVKVKTEAAVGGENDRARDRDARDGGRGRERDRQHGERDRERDASRERERARERDGRALERVDSRGGRTPPAHHRSDTPHTLAPPGQGGDRSPRPKSPSDAKPPGQRSPNPHTTTTAHPPAPTVGDRTLRRDQQASRPPSTGPAGRPPTPVGSFGARDGRDAREGPSQRPPTPRADSSVAALKPRDGATPRPGSPAPPSVTVTEPADSTAPANDRPRSPNPPPAPRSTTPSADGTERPPSRPRGPDTGAGMFTSRKFKHSVSGNKGVTEMKGRASPAVAIGSVKTEPGDGDKGDKKDKGKDRDRRPDPAPVPVGGAGSKGDLRPVIPQAPASRPAPPRMVVTDEVGRAQPPPPTSGALPPTAAPAAGVAVATGQVAPNDDAESGAEEEAEPQPIMLPRAKYINLVPVLKIPPKQEPTREEKDKAAREGISHQPGPYVPERKWVGVDGTVAKDGRFFKWNERLPDPVMIIAPYTFF